MSDTATNRDSSYLKAHAEIEGDGSKLPFHQFPAMQRFEQHWQALAKRGLSVPEHERRIAETFFLWGWFDARFTP